jgi:hypothetical protein
MLQWGNYSNYGYSKPYTARPARRLRPGFDYNRASACANASRGAPRAAPAGPAAHGAGALVLAQMAPSSGSQPYSF